MVVLVAAQVAAARHLGHIDGLGDDQGRRGRGWGGGGRLGPRSRRVVPPGVTCNKDSHLLVWSTEYIFLLEMKQGQCVCPFSWSVHCNFTGDGKCNERGWACTPHPHQPGASLPSWWNVRQKAAVATLCTLWYELYTEMYRDYPGTPSLQCCARNILTVHRKTLTQCITFKRGGRVESILLYSVVLQVWRPASTPICG